MSSGIRRENGTTNHLGDIASGPKAANGLPLLSGTSLDGDAAVLDSFESYTAAANVHGLNGGAVGSRSARFTNAWRYYDTFIPYFGAIDDFESYSAASNVNGLSGGGPQWTTNWVGY